MTIDVCHLDQISCRNTHTSIQLEDKKRQTIHVTTTTYIFSLHCSVHVVGSPAFLKKISSENRLFTAYDVVQGVECLKFL